jgi:hypothetical protein
MADPTWAEIKSALLTTYKAVAQQAYSAQSMADRNYAVVKLSELREAISDADRHISAESASTGGSCAVVVFGDPA